MTKTIIGVPVAKDYMIDIRTAGYCAEEAKAPGVEWGYASTRDAGVGRDGIAYCALKDPDVTHVYMMDYDVVPPVGTLQKLLSLDVPIAAGIYPMIMAGSNSAWSFKIDRDWWETTKPLPEGLIEATMIGGSTVLVKREVFEKVVRPWWRLEYHPINDLGEYMRWGEDEYFSLVVRMAGYKIIVDPTLICDHFNYKSVLTLTTGYTMEYQSLLGE